MATVTTVELWDKLACDSGVRLAVVPDVIDAKDTHTLDGRDELTLTLRRESPAWSSVREGRVLRVALDDGTWEEWRIVGVGQQRTRDNELVADLQAAPVRQDLARGFCRRTEADGLVYYDFEYLGLTPAQLVALILADAPAYFVADVVTPTVALDFRFEWTTPLAALLQLAADSSSELSVTRHDALHYHVSLVAAVGSAAPALYALVGKNVTGFKRSTSTDEQATRLLPRGGGDEGDSRTMARARWYVSAKVAGVSVDLTDPSGGDGPAQFADQFNGLYLRETGGTVRAITDTVVVTAATTRLSIATTTGFTVGDLVELRSTAGGADLTYLDDPANQALYGVIPKMWERTDLVPAVQNLVVNPCLNGTYAAGIPDTGWAKVGAPTCAETGPGLYTRRGGKSCHVTAAAKDLGLTTVAISISPTAARPHFSGYFTLHIVSGRVRVELVDVTNGVVYPDQKLSKGWSTVTGVWTDLGFEGPLDFFALGCASMQMRVVADGAAAEFYVDSAQLTQTADPQSFVSGDGARMLWQAANDELADRGAPWLTVEVSLLDLQRAFPAAFPYDALALGGTVVLRDTDLGLDTTTRIDSIARDLYTPLASSVSLSNRPIDLTDILLRPHKHSRLPGGGADYDDLNLLAAPTGLAVSTLVEETSLLIKWSLVNEDRRIQYYEVEVFRAGDSYWRALPRVLRGDGVGETGSVVMPGVLNGETWDVRVRGVIEGLQMHSAWATVADHLVTLPVVAIVTLVAHTPLADGVSYEVLFGQGCYWVTVYTRTNDATGGANPTETTLCDSGYVKRPAGAAPHGFLTVRAPVGKWLRALVIGYTEDWQSGTVLGIVEDEVPAVPPGAPDPATVSLTTAHETSLDVHVDHPTTATGDLRLWVNGGLWMTVANAGGVHQDVTMVGLAPSTAFNVTVDCVVSGVPSAMSAVVVMATTALTLDAPTSFHAAGSAGDPKMRFTWAMGANASAQNAVTVIQESATDAWAGEEAVVPVTPDSLLETLPLAVSAGSNVHGAGSYYFRARHTAPGCTASAWTASHYATYGGDDE